MGNHSSASVFSVWALVAVAVSGCGLGSGDDRPVLATQQQGLVGEQIEGSLIIPMDLRWQDRGMLRAYGLVYRLLANNVPVQWSVASTKSQNGVDFTAEVRDLETGASRGHVAYRGGPFVITAEHREAALPIVLDWLAADCETVVHEALAPFQSDDAVTLSSAPRMAVARDRYQTIAFANFNAAGIPDSTGASWSYASPDLLDESELLGATNTSSSDGALLTESGAPAYCHLTFTYYWETWKSENVVRELRSWLDSSPATHVFAQAQSASTLENSEAGRFLTTGGLVDDGRTPYYVRALEPTSPLAQYHGWFMGSPDVLDSIGLAPNSSFHDATELLLGNKWASTSRERVVLLSGPMDGNTTKGRVTYLAGFDYGINVPVSRNPWTNGVRVLLNSVLASECNRAELQPRVRLRQDEAVTVTGDRATFVVLYANDGPTAASAAELHAAVPAGTELISASDGAMHAAGDLRWQLGELAVGATGAVSFTVALKAGAGQYTSDSRLAYRVGVTPKELQSSQTLEHGENHRPDTFFLAAPPSPTNLTEATFALGSDHTTVTFQCSLDGAPYAACDATFTLTGLALGDHTLLARARDASGNVDLTPASHAWHINGAPLARDDQATVSEDAAETLLDVLGNDDRGDLPAAISAVTAAAHGVVVVRGAEVGYTPAADYHGPDAFTYTLTDADGETSTAAVAIDVVSVDDVPVANDDAATVSEDGEVSIAVLANDTGLGDPPVAITATSAPFHGEVVVAGDQLRYTPQPNYHGPELFTYTVTDGDGQSATAQVTITVESANDLPVAVADVATVSEDSAGVVIDVLANDSIADQPGAVSAVTAPAHGTAAVTAGGVIYVPASDYFGADAFDYTLTDADGDTATATVTIDVRSVDDVPVAVADSATVLEDTEAVIAVLANDTGLGDGPVTIVSVSAASRGVASVLGTSVRYVPSPDAHGADSFSYTIADVDGQTSTATVSIDITPVDDLPVAVDDVATVDEDSQGNTLAVLANDVVGDGPASVSIAVPPGHGAAAVMAGMITYAPEPDYHGADALTYTITDADGQQASATVAITINSVNDTPTAVADTADVLGNQTVLVPVLANDLNLGDAPVTVIAVSAPASGTAAIEGAAIRYVPNWYFTGTVSFTYTLADADGEQSTAMVSIAVTSVNLTPTANDDVATLAEDTSALIAVRANDSGGDLPVVLDSVTAPAHGTAVIEGDEVRYTPAPDYFGPDAFTYTVRDEDGETATANVVVTVTPVNDTPVANVDTFTVLEDSGPTLLDVLANDTGLGDAPITILSFTPAPNGTLAMVGDKIQYTPKLNHNGSDVFTYRIRDADNQQSSTTVFVNVTPVNDPPTANDDTFTVTAGVQATLDPLFNDRDVDGNPLTLASVGTPTAGTVGIVANRAVYLAPVGFTGQASFTYVVSDGRGGTASATVTIDVTP
ncbi:MAG: Ig-like domain-containing protein [Kofleriaceae bacterium]